MVKETRLNPLAIKMVVDQFLHKAVDGDNNRFVDDILEGKKELWSVPFHGFVVLHIEQEKEEPKLKYLFIDAVQGRFLYNKEGINTLLALAQSQDCCKILCKTRTVGIARLMTRLDFEPTDLIEDDGYIWYERELNNV